MSPTSNRLAMLDRFLLRATEDQIATLVAQARMRGITPSDYVALVVDQAAMRRAKVIFRREPPAPGGAA